MANGRFTFQTRRWKIDLMIHHGKHLSYYPEKRDRQRKYEHPKIDGKYLIRETFSGQVEKLLVGFEVVAVAAKPRESLPVSLTSAVQGISNG